ncbi:hypothetical protein [Mariniblastus fucicola]|uniref:Uncharacterized protein n=1 Tax=Mariniblastus fucicola TaxID=980251 RepID=A0A5B9PFH1_9BACT|nr:hypothetical protein [Mariniblastus fucicola]QEG24299.1 hypothetical protein MFFC18_42170 [Mariniblastus fucicola]
MRYLITVLAITTLTIAAGCSPQPQTATIDPDEPLTVEVWTELDIGQKYELETLEWLRESNPKLKGERQWTKFMKEVVVPQRRKDIPTDY